MPSAEQKLERFANTVVGDATRERDSILERLRAESEHKVADSIAAIDRESKERKAKAAEEASKEVAHAVAQAELAARKRLLAARDEIIATALGMLEARLADFAASDGYRGYLAENAAEALGAVGYVAGAASGTFTLTLAPGDYAKHGADIAALAPGALVVAGEATQIGGCKAANTKLGLHADNSLRRKLSLCEGELLVASGLRVDAEAAGGAAHKT